MYDCNVVEFDVPLATGLRVIEITWLVLLIRCCTKKKSTLEVISIKHCDRIELISNLVLNSTVKK